MIDNINNINNIDNINIIDEIDMIEMQYSAGLTFMTLAFLYLFYAVFYTNTPYKIPKPFLLLYAIGGIFLILKNIQEHNTYIAINEFIGCAIALSLYFRM